MNIITNTGALNLSTEPYFNSIDNYIYLHHTDVLLVIPVFPETITDTIGTNYASTPIMGRSAPIYTYSGSGPRSVDISLKLHRDLMNQVNTDITRPLLSNYSLNKKYQDLQTLLNRNDYMEILINQLQSSALPSYVVAQKMVNPPLVSIRIGDEIFCKGVIDGGVNVAYSGPIIANSIYDPVTGVELRELDAQGRMTSQRRVGKGKYALVDIQFKVTEVDPYDAATVAELGGLRGLNRTLEKNLYKVSV